MAGLIIRCPLTGASWTRSKAKAISKARKSELQPACRGQLDQSHDTPLPNAIDLSFGEVKRGGRILVGMFEETSERMRQLYRLLES
jgi:hypothetical protein